MKPFSKPLCSCLILFFSLLLAFNGVSAGEKQQPLVLRIALFDNPSFYLMNAWGYNSYEHVYMLGVRDAFLYYQQLHLPFVYQSFFYGNNPMDLFGQVPAIHNWEPNLIIGPHYSNHFFMLQHSFKQTLVLSPYASDAKISSLPDNFQSNAINDRHLITILQKFIKRFLPGKTIVDVTQMDCKDCVDFSHDLKRVKSNKIISSNFVANRISDINIQSILRHYHRDDVIMLNVGSYLLSRELINKISYEYNKQHFTFINFLDNWGVKEDSIYYRNNVTVYRMFPDLFSIKEDSFQKFINNQSPSKQLLTNQVSFVVYNAIRSVLDAYLLYGNKVSGKGLNAKLINAYLYAIHHNKYWYKMREYVVTRFDNQHAKDIARISW